MARTGAKSGTAGAVQELVRIKNVLWINCLDKVVL